MWATRTATVLAAIAGNLTHLHLYVTALYASAGHGGWTEFGDSLKKSFESSACLPCSIFTDLAALIGWIGGPFYILCIVLFFRSASLHVAALLSILGLIALDQVWFNASNTKDWYTTLAPIYLGSISTVVLVLLLVVGTLSKRQTGDKGAHTRDDHAL